MMNKKAFSALCFLFSITLFSQSPGGVGTASLTAWFKAEGLTAGNVTSWTTSFPTGGSAITLSDPSSPYSQSTNANLSSNNFFNYNQYVDFAGNTLATQKLLYNLSSFNLLQNGAAAADAGSFFVVYKSDGTDCVVYWRPSAGDDGIQCRGWGRLAIGTSGNSLNASRDWASTTTQQDIISYKGNRSGAATMTAFRNATTFGSSLASQALGLQSLSFGAKHTTAGPVFSEFFSGNLAEVVFFNKTVSTNEQDRVHSYLATKFGITLPINYLASNSAVTYSTVGTYTNNIIGIARDNGASGSVLLQKQSHNIDDSVRIYKGALATTNANNTETFTNDISYVMMGANNGKLCGAFPYSEITTSCGIVRRIQREWKVTKTNYAEAYNMDIKLNACAGTGTINLADLSLLVDDDGDFSNGCTSCYYNGDGTGLIISYANPVITFSNITSTHIPNNATRYITLGSNNTSTPLPIVLTEFLGECNKADNKMELTWKTASETNNAYFRIDRSNDAINWETITTLKGAGNSSIQQTYNFRDDLSDVRAGAGNAMYYRLAQIDTDGKEEIFNKNIISTVLCEDSGDIFTPNPASDHIYIKNHNRYKSYEIIDQLGKVVKNGELNSNTISLEGLVNLYYEVRLLDKNSKSTTQKLLIKRQED